MNEHLITEKHIAEFIENLVRKEYAEGSIEKYGRDVRRFYAWLDNGILKEESASGWKRHLIAAGYSPVTINSTLVAVNTFFKFHGWSECCVKELRIQRKLFREREKELTRDEYMRLIETAQTKGKERLALLMETICATGIRVSEVKYITVEALLQGRTEVALKGKIRTILIPNKLCRKLLKYAKKQKIASGEVFLTRSGKGLSRRQIWAEMKAICRCAGVAESKVFPHNLRHLFARVFYKA